MKKHDNSSVSLKMAVAMALAATLAGCGKKDEAPVTPAVTAAPVAPAVAPVAEQAPEATLVSTVTSWTPEAMEELLAPVALYPDPILMQVLTAAGNPQEILDAGNWILQNEKLTGDSLDQAATKIGFTPPTRAILQFPATLDMMCQEMAWTSELGQAFVTDQQGVLDAVQRLRLQAQEVGNLKDSPQMDVAFEEQDGEQVIYLKPADPKVVYVPQYDPVAVYAPAPVATTTTVVQEGHSTSALVTTGLLAFGAGMLVNEIFDDDDDWDNYYPRYGYGGGYYRPPYPYRPAYGNGYYPGHSYNRPPGYNSGWNNNGWQNNGNINTGDININTGGNKINNMNGGNHFGGSPISKANPKRDMAKVNQRSAKNAGADGKRPGAKAGGSDWKGQSGYAGAKKSSSGKPTADMANKARDQAGKTSKAGGKQPKVQGGYAGAKTASNNKSAGNNTRDLQKPNTGNKQKTNTANMQKPNTGNKQKANAANMQKPNAGSRDIQKPQQKQQTNKPAARPQGQGDRGRSQSSGGNNSSRQPQQQNRQASQQRSGGGNHSSAVSGSRNGGGSAKASSQRGQQSRSGSGGGNRAKRN